MINVNSHENRSTTRVLRIVALLYYLCFNVHTNVVEQNMVGV